MGTLIFIAIILFIIYMFLQDKKKVSANTTQIGGMQVKYSILVDGLLAQPHSKVVRLVEDEIEIHVTTDYAKVSFTIIQSFSKVIVRWQQLSQILGNMSERWEFSESIDQIQMIKKIVYDIQEKQNKEVNWSGIDKSIEQVTRTIKLDETIHSPTKGKSTIQSFNSEIDAGRIVLYKLERVAGQREFRAHTSLGIMLVKEEHLEYIEVDELDTLNVLVEGTFEVTTNEIGVQYLYPLINGLTIAV